MGVNITECLKPTRPLFVVVGATIVIVAQKYHSQEISQICLFRMTLVGDPKIDSEGHGERYRLREDELMKGSSPGRETTHLERPAGVGRDG